MHCEKEKAVKYGATLWSWIKRWIRFEMTHLCLFPQHLSTRVDYTQMSGQNYMSFTVNRTSTVITQSIKMCFSCQSLIRANTFTRDNPTALHLTDKSINNLQTSLEVPASLWKKIEFSNATLICTWETTFKFSSHGLFELHRWNSIVFSPLPDLDHILDAPDTHASHCGVTSRLLKNKNIYIYHPCGVCWFV